ncbi:MAG: hypothetical protein ABR958_07535 [Dehalococcoidales bacterium]|jgi:hypothetical protein
MNSDSFTGTNYFQDDKTRNIPKNMRGWERVGYFGSYLLYASKNLRRIVEPETGKIIAQYQLNQKEEGETDGTTPDLEADGRAG